VFLKLDVMPLSFVISGTPVAPGTVILEGEGSSENLHMAWKVSMNILENASGIATRTGRLIGRIHSANPRVQLVTTRKCFSSTKELAIKAVYFRGRPAPQARSFGIGTDIHAASGFHGWS